MSALHLPQRTRARPGRPGRTARVDDRVAGRSERYRVAMTGLAPALLLVAVVYHPPLGDLRDNDAVTSALVSDTTRWAIAHVVVGVAAALLVLSFLAVETFLRDRGAPEATRPAALGVPFVVVGSVLFAFLPAMEIAMLGVHEAGGDVVASMNEMDTYFIPTLVVSAALFAGGMILFAVAVARSHVLGRGLTAVVVGALVVAALSRFAPFGPALYVNAAALLVALVPLATAMATPRQVPQETG